MKHYLRIFIIVIISFYATYSLIPTIILGTDERNILFVIGGLLLINLIIRPIFSLILLPINILTFGFLSFLFNILFLFALTKFLPGFQILPYDFPGFNAQGFIVQPASLTAAGTIIASAVIITMVQKVLHFIFD